MSTIVKVVSLSLTNLNSAEYTRFLSSFSSLVKTAKPSALGIPTDLFAAFEGNVEKLVQVGNQSRMSEETGEMENLDQQRDAQVVYILNSIRNERKAANAERKKAAAALYTLLHTYIGMQELPTEQETQTVDNFMKDIQPEVVMGQLTTLHLEEAVAELQALNEQYKNLAADRSEGQIARYVENTQKIRAVTDPQYDEMEVRAFAESVAKPTEVTKDFIQKLNKLKSETKAAYNQRMAQLPKKEKASPPPADGSK